MLYFNLTKWYALQCGSFNVKCEILVVVNAKSSTVLNVFLLSFRYFVDASVEFTASVY
jgi:hypothetical protein